MKLALVFASLLVLPPQEKEIDNPEFQGWKGLKPGSWVRTKTAMDLGPIQTETITVAKLIEGSDDKVVLELAITTTVAGAEMKRDPEQVTVRSRIRETQLTAEGGKFTKSAEGEETIEVLGRKMKCRWIEGKVEKDNLKGKGKTWFHPDIVGGVAKSTFKIEEPIQATAETAVVETRLKE